MTNHTISEKRANEIGIICLHIMALFEEMNVTYGEFMTGIAFVLDRFFQRYPNDAEVDQWMANLTRAIRDRRKARAN